MNEKKKQFRLELPDEINRKVLSAAALSGKTKHEWLMSAVKQLSETVV
jgi:hypothetical protein